MIYKFKSRASGDLIMLGADGNQMLQLAGREPAARGIFDVADMPALIDALQAAVADAEQQTKAGSGGNTDGAQAEDKPAAQAVGLRQRLWPMVEMLRRCHAADEPIVWGV
ncbi:MAG: DUF1840 domain-containing protein [Rubrivivax sp.]|nr:DUF1840 domain-containing protein [Rubrivivax sp.]